MSIQDILQVLHKIWGMPSLDKIQWKNEYEFRNKKKLYDVPNRRVFKNRKLQLLRLKFDWKAKHGNCKLHVWTTLQKLSIIKKNQMPFYK
jgi:hypothetical protein